MMWITILKVGLVLGAVSPGEGALYARVWPPRAPPPAAFRPGALLRPHQRLPAPAATPAASRRAPYLLYRTAPHHHRYAVRQVGPAVRQAGPAWRSAARPPALPVLPVIPAPAAPHYEPLRAGTTPPLVHYDAGGIHTIPAPDLSLAEKPIVVLEAAGAPPPGPSTHVAAGAPPRSSATHAAAGHVINNQDHIYMMRTNQVMPDAEHQSIRGYTERPQLSYEVTEKYVEPVYHMAKIETPVGFSKTQSVAPLAALEAYLRGGAAPEYRPAAPPRAVALPLPHHYSLQGFHGFSGFPPQQDLMSTGADSVMVPSDALYQSDPLFLQKLQQQLLQRFPALEFVPYSAELMPHNPQNEAPQPQQLFLLENEEIKQLPEPFLSSESKNVVQRETQESSLVTLLPQASVVSDGTEREEPTTAPLPRDTTVEPVAAEARPATATVQYVAESSTEPPAARLAAPDSAHNSTPIYYAQVGHSVGSLVADGFYSAVNDVRAAAAMEQVALESTPRTTAAPENVTTSSSINTDLNTDLKKYFVKNEMSENKNVTELKPLLGVPFAKPPDSVKLAYTLLRTEEKEPKTTREGAVYAGQIVEASISEDHEFNSQKATFTKRAPIRLHVADEGTSRALLTSSTPKGTLLKANIPPKSKLTLDNNTGEPVLRIYASYADSPSRRQVVTSKLTTLASLKPVAADSWKAAAVRGADKSQGFDGNQLTKFGLKLSSRSDDYVPLFEEYDE